jgi:tRNA 5-methylaminomethyl-2-thiouridine biosynthesis bifunctional protein
MKLTPAAIEWRLGVPFSLDFQDFYFSLKDAFQESQYVFIEQNNLPSRWQSIEKLKFNFNIAELGFGAGLNFLSCCQLWLQLAPPDRTLNYYAAESRPLKLSDLSKILKLWPSLNKVTESLLAQYPEPLKGYHNIELFGGRVRLCLMLGCAQEMFDSLGESDTKDLYLYNKNPIDVWFLDGFSPSKNPDIWTSELFHTVASLSSSSTTLSTFSAASTVARNLTKSGFDVEHIKGFGKKRQMIKARFKGLERGQSKTLDTNPWNLNSKPRLINKKPCSVAIVGAGIAGCTAALALAKRGYKVTIIDRYGKAGEGGSGNKRAIVYPKLSVRDDPLPKINISALMLASRYYQPFWDMGFGEQCGVLLLPENSKAEEEFIRIINRFQALTSFVQLLTGAQLTDVSGINLESNMGLFFPTLGWLPPSAVCNHILESLAIPVTKGDVCKFQKDKADGLWTLFDNKNHPITQADILVLANAYGISQFEETDFLRTKALRGQVTELPSSYSSENIKTVICGAGYITPSHGGSHTCGATYNHTTLTTKLRPEDHEKNIAQMLRTDQGLAAALGPFDINNLDGRANYRCTTRDYLPITGPVPDLNQMIQDFAFLRKDARKTNSIKGTYADNLYVNCGMGSRGLTYAPLTAEVLSADINQQLCPLERELRLAMHPSRFIIRDLKKKRI